MKSTEASEEEPNKRFEKVYALIEDHDGELLRSIEAAKPRLIDLFNEWKRKHKSQTAEKNSESLVRVTTSDDIHQSQSMPLVVEKGGDAAHAESLENRLIHNRIIRTLGKLQ